MRKIILMLFLALGMACCFALGTQGQEVDKTEPEGMNPKARFHKAAVSQAQESDIVPQSAQEEQHRMHDAVKPRTQNMEQHTTAHDQTEAEVCNYLCPNLLKKAAEQDRELFLEEISRTQDRREWFLGYKELLDSQAGILEPPASLYDSFPAESLDRLFRVVQAEIGDEYSFDQKCNVASVIFNRVKHDKFGDTLDEVLTADQFATISNGRYLRAQVSDETILACEYSFMMGDTTGGCLFFDSNRSLRYEFAFNDGAHNFYALKSQ